MRKLRNLLPVLALLVALSACAEEQPAAEQPQAQIAPSEVVQEEEPVPEPPAGAVLCEQPAQDSPVVEIGPNGGYVSVGRHLLSVPPGAVSGRVPFQMRQPQAPYVVVQVGPHGHQFSRSSFLVVSTAGCQDPDPSRPYKVVRWTRGAWEDVPQATLTITPRGRQDGMATVQEITAVGQLDALSNYAIATAD